MVKAHTVTRVTPPAIAMMSSLKMSASLENIVNCRRLIMYSLVFSVNFTIPKDKLSQIVKTNRRMKL